MEDDEPVDEEIENIICFLCNNLNSPGLILCEHQFVC